MKIIKIMRCVFAILPEAFLLSVSSVLLVVAAEGVQHIVEWHIGMYESRTAFGAKQGDPLRMSFGVLKAAAILSACYFIPKKLSKAFGPSPKFGSFNRDMLRKLWDPRLGVSGMIVMFIIAGPLIYLHFKLSYFAMGHAWSVAILFLDSLVVGIIALVMGLCVWANDKVEHDTDQAKQDAA
jgi:hypothetical protein